MCHVFKNKLGSKPELFLGNTHLQNEKQHKNSRIDF